jgi:hypothetical protein
MAGSRIIFIALGGGCPKPGVEGGRGWFGCASRTNKEGLVSRVYFRVHGLSRVKGRDSEST